MRRLILSVLVLVAVHSSATAQPRTMRLDYYHPGNSTQELFSVDKVVLEPLPWPGNPHRSVDTSNLGKYLFEVSDPSSKRVLYSRF